jgi:hypothetical protein
VTNRAEQGDTTSFDEPMLTRRPRAPIYYHGGVAGLAVGSFILPGLLVHPNPSEDVWYASADDYFCFVTIDLGQAWHSASLCAEERGDAAVYQVQPIGRLWLDIDGTGLNFACRKARILARCGIPSWLREAWKADPNFIDEVPVPIVERAKFLELKRQWRNPA